MDSMEAPKKKIKPNSDESLPNDITITVLAKVPRSYYPFLSLVSKNFQSLICSKDLYTVRADLGTTENTVFVCLKLPTTDNLCWYNLWKSPHNHSKHLLVPIKYSYDTIHSTSVALFESFGYIIGGHDDFSCTVKRFCRKNTSLRENVCAMNVARKNAIVHPFRDKIYVMGGCNDSETTNWAEVFDTKTQTWESFICPDVLRGYKIYKIKDLFSKLYVWTDTKDYTYDVNEDRWEVLEESLSRSKTWCVVDKTWCVGDKIVYHLDHIFGFRWFDSQQNIWRKVLGLSTLNHKYGITRSKGMIEIIEHNHKLLVFWDKFEKRGGSLNRDKKIWCAEIFLRQRFGEIWGYIEWIDDVLKVSSSYDLVNCLNRSV